MKTIKSQQPIVDGWPEGSQAYRLGVLEGVCEVWAIVKDGVFIGSDMHEMDTGMVLSAKRDLKKPHDQCVVDLCNGMLESAKDERYELAAVVRNLLHVLNVDTGKLVYGENLRPSIR